MARTPSTMVALGTPAPPFELPDATGTKFRLSDIAAGRPALVMFICNHCPFVKHVRSELAAIGRDYGDSPKGNGRVGIIAVMSNDIENYPDDRPELMAKEANEAGYTFPYVHDATQAVAKAYHAACTPDFFLYDKDGKLAYRGQLDNSRPGNGVPVTGKDLRAAIDAVIAGKSPGADQKPSIGCNIKWMAGNAPTG